MIHTSAYRNSTRKRKEEEMAKTARDIQTTQAVLPAGPRRVPYIGNLFLLGGALPGHLQELQRTYGNMATIYFGQTPVVVLFRPEHVRYVLVEHPGNFSNRGAFQEGNSVANEGLLTIDGEKQRRQRRA